MTTKKELREALQRIVTINDRYANHNNALLVLPWRESDAQEYRDAHASARALLARPARVVGWRLRSDDKDLRCETWRISEASPPATTLAMARNTRRVRGGTLYRLVVR